MSSEIDDFLRRIMADRVEVDDDDEIIDAEIVEEDESPSQRPMGDRVGSVFRDDAAGLAAVIEHADDRMDERLHENFDHRLGQFDATTVEAEDGTDDARETRAEQLNRLLRSRNSLQNAILLTEILNRPEHRW